MIQGGNKNEEEAMELHGSYTNNLPNLQGRDTQIRGWPSDALGWPLIVTDMN